MAEIWKPPNFFRDFHELFSKSECIDPRRRCKIRTAIRVKRLSGGCSDLLRHLEVGHRVGVTVRYEPNYLGFFVERGTLVIIGEWRYVKIYLQYLQAVL